MADGMPLPDTSPRMPNGTGPEYVEIESEDTPSEAPMSATQDERLLSYVIARLEECVTYRENTLRDHLQRLWKIYDAKPEYTSKNTPWENASNISVALAATFVDQFVAKHVNALRSPVPFLTLSSYRAEYVDGVRALSDYLDWAEKSLWKGQQLVEDFERDRCKIGTGVGFVGFVDVPYVTRDDVTQGPQAKGRMKHPDPKWIPREDFAITPGYDDEDKAPLVGHRAWMSKSQLMRLAYESQLTVDFDKITPSANYEGEADELTADEVRPYEIYFVSFCYDLDGDDFPEEYDAVVHYDSKQLLHYAPNRRAYGKRPYFHAPFVRREGEFDGLGICEQSEHYQAEVSTIHNQRRDNATLANNVMLKGRPSNYLTERTRWFPGKIWLVNDVNDLNILPMPTHYMSTVTDEQISIGLAERRVGISDAALGRESTNTNRAAATTTLTLMEQGAQRDDLSVTLARNAFQRYGELLLETLQLNGLPDATAGTSPENILGAERGQLVRDLVEREDSILGIVGVKVEVSTRAINKAIKKQEDQQLYSMIVNHAMQVTKMLGLVMSPQTPPPVRDFFLNSIKAAEQVLRRIVEDSGHYELDTIFLNETLGGAMGAARMGDMNGSTPADSGGPGGAGGPVPQGPGPGTVLQ